MAFDTAVSGINAATADLGVIGNNIANSSLFATIVVKVRALLSPMLQAKIPGLKWSTAVHIQTLFFSSRRMFVIHLSRLLALSIPGHRHQAK